VAEPGPRPWRAFAGPIAAIALFSLTTGLSYPLLSLVLARQGVGSAAIGLNAMMMPLGMVVSSLLIPRAARLAGLVGLWLGSLWSLAALILVLGAVRDLTLWFPLRFALGATVNVTLVLGEMWINQLATTRNRGFATGLYSTLGALGFAAGPAILALAGSAGWPPFLIGAAGPLAVIAVIAATRGSLPALEAGRPVPLLPFARAIPLLLLAVIVAAFFDQAILALLPIYGLASGLGERAATLLLAAAMLGNVALLVPIGWLSDRIPRHLVIAGLALLTAGLGLALLALGGRGWLAWPLAFVWGGAAFGIYSVALAALGDRYSGAALLAGSSAFALAWGLGGVAGPAGAGLVMDRFGPGALLVALAAVCGALAVATLLGESKK